MKKMDKVSADSGQKPEEPTLEQWSKLYEVAGVINKLAPWDFFWDRDLVTIMLPGREEPVYCSVMGRIGECYAIGIYPGYEAVMSYYRLANHPADEPFYFTGYEQNCLICHYGDREEVLPKDREILKKLGLRFRGRNEWIYFRAMQPGFFPWFIDAGQADILIQSLENFVMACRHLLEGKLEVDFEGGETLLRFYSPEKELWLNTAAKMPPIQFTLPALIIKDDILIARLKSKKQHNKQIEFEVAYFPAPIQARKEDRPYLPQLIMLADKKSGLPLNQHVFKPGETIEDAILEMIAGYIVKHGRPSVIYVRDNRTACYLDDLCRKLDIKLVQGKGMPVSNALFKSMLDFMG